MAIHHATQKRAEKSGIALIEHSRTDFEARIPAFNVYVRAYMVAQALDEALALLKLKKEYQTWEVVAEGDRDDSDCTEVTVKVPRVGAFGPFKPSKAFSEAFDKWQERLVKVSEEGTEEEVEQEEEVQAEEDEKASGSVVSANYRARYAEAGHPAHCGDWLAVWLNTNLSTIDAKAKAQFDHVLFEHICAMNGVDLSKYKHEGKGWQGRLRMTGRNMLAKAVAKQGHIKVLETMGNEVPADKDWLAVQRFVSLKKEVAR